MKKYGYLLLIMAVVQVAFGQTLPWKKEGKGDLNGGCVNDLVPGDLTGRSASTNKSVRYPGTQYTPRGTMLVQDFEGTFPPTGWDTSSAPGGGQGGVTLIPWHKDGDYFYSGAFGTAYGWGYSLNGWLRILNLNLSSVSTASLSFWWESSYYWHVNPYDNGDLFVEVSTDNGVSWDTLWTFGDSANIVQSGVPWPWENFVWYHSTVSLTAYAGNANVRVGFHVVADDNADIGMDSVAVDTTRTGIIESGIQAAPSGFIGCMQNPTRDNPVIVYNVNNPGPVQIRVFDNLGRQINCLVNRLETPGRKTVLWITDDLPRGVYNLKLEANGMMYFKQLVLIR